MSSFISSDAKELFLKQGVLHIPGAMPSRALEPLRNFIRSELGRRKILKGNVVSSQHFKGVPFFQQITRLSQMIKPDEFTLRSLFPSGLVAEMTSFLAQGRGAAAVPPQLLLSPPQKDPWTLSRLNWHLDLTPSSKDEIPGVQAFVLIDDLHTKGGGTLVLAGSHRLHSLQNGKNAVQILKEDARTKALFAQDSEEALDVFRPVQVHGVDVSVVEMTGRAGDVYIMDMRALHAPSINSSSRIRMMATVRYLVHS